MKKISKSDTTPEMEERANAGIAKLVRAQSNHFKPGTYVQMNNRRYLVNQYVHNTVILIGDDGKATRVDNPYYMQWRK